MKYSIKLWKNTVLCHIMLEKDGGCVMCNNSNKEKDKKTVLTEFTKGANKGNAPDPEQVMLKIKEQKEKNKTQR